MRGRWWLVGAIVLTACMSFPTGDFYRYGSDYHLTSSRDGLVDLIRNLASRMRILTDYHRDSADIVTITTYYIEYRDPENGRREYRVRYEMSISQMGRDEDRHQLLSIACLVESKGIHEDSWQAEPSRVPCQTKFLAALDRELEPIKRKARR